MGDFLQKIRRGTSLERRIHVAPQYYKIHDEIIQLRDNYIAHSSDEKLESGKVYVVFNPKNHEQFVIRDHWSGVLGTGGMSSFPSEVIEHLENLLKTITNKFEKLNFKLTEMHQKKMLVVKKK